MKLTEEQISATLKFVGDTVTADFVQQVVEIFPDGAPFAYMQGPLVNSIKKRGEGVTVQQVQSDVKAELTAKKPAEPGQKKPGDTKRITREYFDSLLIEQRLIDAVVPDTRTKLFGETFSSPITTAALSHLGKSKDGKSLLMEYAMGARKADVLHFVGMCTNEEFGQIVETGARTVRIVKPYKDESVIYDELSFARENGAIAVGMDIDHIFSIYGEVDMLGDIEMEPKSADRLHTYIEAAGLPFIVKGVLSVADARKAKEIGAAGIIISHHGGRMSYVTPPLMMLSGIREAVGEEMTIFVDCGVQSGLDAYKALALGADAASVGTHLIPKVREGGADAVSDRILAMTGELAGAMAFTGVADTTLFDPSVIHPYCG